MMHTKSFFFSLSILAVLLAGCQGDPRAERIKKKEAAINIGADPRTLDPSLLSDLPSARVIMCFARGLTMLNDKGQPRPDMAESWTVSPDGLTYDFKLRPARWSNGEPVTADDYVYTWTHRVLNPKIAAEYAYQIFNYVKGALEFYQNQALGADSVGVKAVAPDRLRVTLKSPAPFFPSVAAHQAYYPVSKKVDQANSDWAKRAETYVGCGPFLMDGYNPGDRITGRKNPNYWDAAHVGMERLTLLCMEKELTERIAFENGEIDGTDQVPRADIDSLKGTPEIRFTPLYSNYFLNVNCKRGPLRDARVRRALGLAIDREAIVRNVTRAGEAPAFYITPPALYKQPPQPTFKDKDYDEARRLLAEAGFPKGAGLPRLQYIYNTQETHQAVAQVLQETWQRELGVQIEIANQEFKVLINNRVAGNFDIARAGWTADFGDPINFLEIFDSKSENNDSHFEDPKYDAMLAAIRAEGDPARREDLMRKTEGYLIDQMAVIPVYFETTPYLATPRLEGYFLNPMGLFDAAALRWKGAAPAGR